MGTREENRPRWGVRASNPERVVGRPLVGSTPALFRHTAPALGHSKGPQGVCVLTKRGRIILASDTIHLCANLAMGNPFPIIVDVAAMLESQGRVLELAGSVHYIVPGHDPKVRSLYPDGRA